ncbi:MAG TPA: MASE1 domain-containing protein, partial [Novosphingobium sp.]|nr:MASE1 domain-containing protein [Novosphingobium sp.]
MYRQALHTPSSRVKLLVAIFIVTLAENQLGQQGLVLRTAIIGSSLGLAGLISVPRNCWLTFALGILAIRVVALFAAGMAPTLALLLAVGVTVQIALASLFLRWRLKDGLDLTRAGQLLDLALAGLIVAPAMGLMVDVLFRRISLAQAANPRTLWQYFSTHDGIITLADWVMPHVLGMVVVVPLALAAITRGIRHPLEWLSRERGALYALLLLAHLLVFSQANAQMLMLVPPALALIAIRLGIRETLLAMLLSMGIASVATANGLGAVAAIYADPPHQISFLRHFYIFAFLCFMPVAATLERNRRLELSLARNTRFTDQILRGMQEVVFRTDMQGRWSFLNPAWLDLTGYSVAESIGTAMRALVSAEGHAEFDEALALLMADDAPEAKLSLD